MPNGFWRWFGDVAAVFLTAVALAWVWEGYGYGAWGSNFLKIVTVGLGIVVMGRFRDRLKPSVQWLWQNFRLYILGAAGYLIARNVLGYMVGMPFFEYDAAAKQFLLVYERGLADPVARAAFLVDASIAGYALLVASGILPGRKWAPWLAEEGFIFSIALGVFWVMQMTFAPSAGEDIRRWSGEVIKITVPAFPVTETERDLLFALRNDRDMQQAPHKDRVRALKDPRDAAGNKRVLTDVERAELEETYKKVREVDRAHEQAISRSLRRTSVLMAPLEEAINPAWKALGDFAPLVVMMVIVVILALAAFIVAPALKHKS